MSDILLPLLLYAGRALAKTGSREDIVRLIEQATGEEIMPPATIESAADACERQARDMAKIAGIMATEGRPLLSKEIAELAFPGVNVWKVRGWIAYFSYRGWIIGKGAPKLFELGSYDDWREELAEAEHRRLAQAALDEKTRREQIADAATLRQEIERLQERLRAAETGGEASPC